MRSRRIWSLLPAGMIALTASAAGADGAMRVYPPDAVLSPQRLERITDYFNADVANGKISGAIVLVQRHGKPVYFKSFGKIDVTTGEPMTPEAIFRIFSMTKPVTSVAAMMLVDDGKLKLDDPVSKYIPSFADTKVGVETKAENGDPVLKLVPLDRPVTIEDLLRQSAGIPYGFYGKSLVRSAYTNANLYAEGTDNAAVAEKIARLPLAEQPGTLWDYGHSMDVLARVIEVVSGKSLYAFEKERLFGPLGMKDTSYSIADPSQHHRIAEPLPSDNNFRTGNSRNPRVFSKWEPGTSGLLMTIGDFSRFAQMLLNGGELDGRRYLKPETFATMTTNHIAPATGVKRGSFYFPGDGFGYGLGFGVRTEAGNATPPPPGSLGEIKWDGAGGTYFWIDRAQDMFVILMIQSPSERGRIQPALKAMVYDAFER
ncbi:serine hydrolase domain-containing protein [Afipia birgiae]|uniref:serine hydrolase domain-containing protein n=1 Tax=Afipia birgiae TaxID=151414 RepID=UPI0002DD2B29|nr:serine hydrolase domain-containing protein [Afipia birgiae]MBX9822568.1 beta-lactamase family protein [Afipia birgiae]